MKAIDLLFNCTKVQKNGFFLILNIKLLKQMDKTYELTLIASGTWSYKQVLFDFTNLKIHRFLAELDNVIQHIQGQESPKGALYYIFLGIRPNLIINIMI